MGGYDSRQDIRVQGCVCVFQARGGREGTRVCSHPAGRLGCELTSARLFSRADRSPIFGLSRIHSRRGSYYFAFGLGYFAAPSGAVAGPGATKIARASAVFLKIPSDAPAPTPTAELLE